MLVIFREARILRFAIGVWCMYASLTYMDLLILRKRGRLTAVKGNKGRGDLFLPVFSP